MSVQERAYHLWEQAGRPTGRDTEFWAQAEQQEKNDEFFINWNHSKPQVNADEFIDVLKKNFSSKESASAWGGRLVNRLRKFVSHISF